MTDLDVERVARESFALAAQHDHVRRELERLALRGRDDSLDLWELAEIVGRLAEAQREQSRHLLDSRRARVTVVA
ncbi:MAG: hypothetical protein NVSMB16_08940 [Acidimicrobiales bacterium]